MRRRPRSPVVAAAGLGMLLLAGPVMGADVVNESVELLSSDRAGNDAFGVAVSVDGDTMAVVAPKDDDSGTDSGSVYVFVRDDGSWVEQAKLLPSDGSAFETLGFLNTATSSLSVSGDTVVVGLPLDSDNGTSSGSVYVFARPAGGWGDPTADVSPSTSLVELHQTAKLVASDGVAGANFGIATSVSGDTLVVGALSDEQGFFSNSGSAYVFVRDAGIWTEKAKLLASDNAAADIFGEAVAVSGTTVVVGARGDDDNGSNSGSAYIFEAPDAGWAAASSPMDETAKLLASDGAASEFFGTSVSISDDTVIVGARGDADLGLGSGSAHVFVVPAGGWSDAAADVNPSTGVPELNEDAKLLASDGRPGDQFGASVGVSGDRVVVGAWGDDDGRNNGGSAFLFEGSGASWVEQAKLHASDRGDLNDFGITVSVSGDVVVVGAPTHTHLGVQSGSAYLFDFVSDAEGPITAAVAVDPNPGAVDQAISTSASVDDSTTGGSSITSADLEIRDGAGNVVLSAAADAADGQFDGVAEDVEATVEPGVIGPGVYDACVRGTDANGNIGEFTCAILVVYDPDGGFVSGAGWIQSDAGFCSLDEACAGADGKAVFGFVSRYLKGATVPTGQTQLQFKAGGLTFHSAEYEWLVVAGPAAQYKGSGTINGSGDYGFLLTAKDSAIDGGPAADTLRIKIWDVASGEVVFDNGADQAIGAGSIVIHK